MVGRRGAGPAQRGRPAPLIPVDLFRNPVFALSVTASICAFAAFAIAFVALPFYFQCVLGRDQVETGLLMTPWPVALGARRAARGPAVRPVAAGVLGAVGMALLAVGLALLSRLPPDAALGIALMMALCGFGFGFFQAPNNRTMLAAAPRAASGAAGGMLAMARLLGHDPRGDGGGAGLPLRARAGRAGQPADRHRLRGRRRGRQRAAAVAADAAEAVASPRRPACWQGR